MSGRPETPGAPIRPWVLGLVFAASALLLLRLFQIIDRHAVNVLFWDQWVLCDAFIRDSSPWELFRWQHGPHRQGIGFLFTKLVADLSGWNTRAEAFAIGGLLGLAMALALGLKARLFGSISASDVAIPLIFTMPAQYQVFIHTTNASHGVVPLLLLVLYCFGWLIRIRAVRYAVVLLLNFLLLYTGFGFFAGILTPLLFGVDCHRAVRSRRRREGILALGGIAASLLSLASFLVGLTLNPANADFQFPDPHYRLYPRFVALVLANFWGVKGTGALPSLVGFSAGALVLWAGWRHARRLFDEDGPRRDRSVVIVVLVSFTSLYCAGLAVGRLSLGLPTAQSSRYIPLLVPAFLGVYLHLLTVSIGVRRNAILAALVLNLVVASFPMRGSDVSFMNHLSRRKQRWVEAYLETGSIEAANRLARFAVYPWSPESIRQKEKLEYLEERKLNLFRGRDAEGP